MCGVAQAGRGPRRPRVVPPLFRLLFFRLLLLSGCRSSRQRSPAAGPRVDPRTAWAPTFGSPQMTKSILAMDLRMNDFGVPGAKLLADGLLQNSSLQTLVLKGCKIGDRGGLALAEVLQTNTTLESLDVGDCDLEVPSLIAFRTVLQYNSTLRELVLDRPLIKSAHVSLPCARGACAGAGRGEL